MPDAVIITDGSADNRTGIGGWCAIVRRSTSLTELTGHAIGTTSNRMEMTAIIEGLRSIAIPSSVHVVSDSAYTLNPLKKGWYVEWLWAEQFRRRPRPNIDLWHELAGLMNFHEIEFFKVKGHSGDYWNTRADKLASLARRNQLELHSRLPNFDEWQFPHYITTPIIQPLTV